MPYTRLRYHLVFATKGRMPWITPDVEDFIYAVLGKAAKDVGARLMETNGVEDHVHTVCAVPPKLQISDFVRHIKSVSTGAVRRCLRGLWAFKWQVGYGCFTLNPMDMDRIFEYVRKQKQHHRRNTLWNPYEKITEDESKTTEDNAVELSSLEGWLLISPRSLWSREATLATLNYALLRARRALIRK